MIIERLLQFAERKGINFSTIEKVAGLSQGLLCKAKKPGTSLGVDKLESILAAYPDLDMNWLFGKDDTDNIHHNLHNVTAGGNIINSGNTEVPEEEAAKGTILTRDDLMELIRRKDEQISRLLSIIENTNRQV